METGTYTCIGGCGGPPVPPHRARAIVWTGEHFVMVRYVATMVHGPYCVACAGPELNRLYAAGIHLGWPAPAPGTKNETRTGDRS
jgi:hypothetical protein